MSNEPVTYGAPKPLAPITDEEAQRWLAAVAGVKRDIAFHHGWRTTADSLVLNALPRLLAERQQYQKERADLVAWLRAYGRHQQDCQDHDASGQCMCLWDYVRAKLEG